MLHYEEDSFSFDAFLDRIFPWRRIRREKSEKRAVLGQKRRILTKEEVQTCSQEVIDQLLQEPDFQEATRVMIYYPVRNEIDLRLLLELAPGKEYYLPITHRHSIEVRRWEKGMPMKRGRRGIPEPEGVAYHGKVDMVLVPGVGFGKDGARLGRGKGYYDRFLKKMRHAKKWGVGYAFQNVRKLPTTKKDIHMDKVIFSWSK